MERIGQILFENVLVPSVYFNPKLAPVHSAAVSVRGEGAVLLGGTGGVGKTSLEMELCLQPDYAFVSDDISILDKDGFVYPNLSYPKIYGYNLESKDEVRDILFSQMKLHDRMAWKLKHRLFGASGVRRKISPETLYQDVINQKIAIDRYFILLKTDVEEIELHQLTAEEAANATLQVMKTEYAQFNNHLFWHKYNRELLGQKTILDIDLVFKNWLGIYTKVFSEIPVFEVKIPLSIPHEAFLRQAGELLSSAN